MGAKRAKKTRKRGQKAASRPQKRTGRGTARPRKRTAKAGKTAKNDASTEELVDMAEAIRILKTTRPTFYRWLRAGKIKGMKLGRQWRFTREDLDRFLKGEPPRVDLPADLSPLIETLAAKVTELDADDLSGEGYSDVQRVASLMIVLGIAMRATDIHISPSIAPDGPGGLATLRYRVDGMLHQAATIDMRLLPAIVEQFKRMAACDIHEKVKPQDGRMLLKPRKPIAGRQIDMLDLRVSFLPAALGEAVTLRILDRSASLIGLDRIDYAPHDRERLMKAIHSPWGVVLLTGPTGSGKTTVLYACINALDHDKLKVMSVEDPVEFFLPGVTQVAVNEREGMTFERATRAILRSDPDAILIGEIRNREALYCAVQAALTGHLVMTTLHTNDAAGGLVRMVDIGVDPFVVADATKLVMSQRLVRLLCEHCRVPDEPDANQLALAAEVSRDGGLGWPPADPQWKKAVGCEKCGQTGYRGRTAIAEMLEVTPEIGKALREGATPDVLKRIAVKQGMTTIAADGIRRAAAGQTSLDEVIHVAR